MESVRTATPDDLATVVALVDEFVTEQRSLRGGVVWAAREAARLTPHAVAAALHAGGASAASHVALIGCLDDAPVGVALATIEPLPGSRPLAVVHVLYVLPDAREVGVGSALLDALVERAEQLGCSGVDATVLPGSRGAKNFFEMHGLVARAISVHRSVGEGP